MAEAAEENRDNSLPADYADLIALLESRERVIDVCRFLKNLPDPSDEQYGIQIELASNGAIPALVGLLSSQSRDEVVEACEAVAALCANIDEVFVRKRSGLETGFLERSFNPVQDELAEVDGIKILADLLDSDLEGVKEVARETLWTCCSFNHANKVSYLRCLVHGLLNQKKDRLEFINALLPDIEVKDEVSVVLDQVMLPVLRIVEDDESKYHSDAVVLMGTLCDQHPASTVSPNRLAAAALELQAFLCEEGALKPISKLIAEGAFHQRLVAAVTSLPNVDAANKSRGVHVMWGLIRRNKSVLNPSRGKLGCESTALIEPLFSIIGWDKKKSPDNEQEAEGEEEEEEDHSDEALLILKALAEQDDEVREKVGDVLDSANSRCSMM